MATPKTYNRTYFAMKVDACEELKAKLRNFLHCRQLNSLIQSSLTVGLYYVFKYIRGALHKRGLLKRVVYAKKVPGNLHPAVRRNDRRGWKR